MKKVILSIFAMLVVAAMVGAGTFAYFSDSETSNNNIFSAGTLDFAIFDPPQQGHQVFNVTNMKPGDVKTGYIVVVNDGSLDAKWKAYISGFESGILDDVLDVKVTLHPTDYDYSALQQEGYTIAGPLNHQIADWTSIKNLCENNDILVWGTNAGPFKPRWAAVYKVEVKMRETAGNDYQGANFTGDINFVAEQF